jgi:Tfp pilus assembly protein PilZ
LYSDEHPTTKDYERRRKQRWRMTRPVELDLGDGRPSTIALTRNVSETGIALRTRENAEIGDRLACKLRSGASTIEVACRVVWTSTQSDGINGLGMEFEDITNSRSAKIRDMLKRRSSRTTAREQRYHNSGTWDSPFDSQSSQPALRKRSRAPKKTGQTGAYVFWIGLGVGVLIGAIFALALAFS